MPRSLYTSSATKFRNNTRPTVIDLYSGAGGTGLAFSKAGFRILGAVEINRNAALTYEKNLGVKVRQIDIRNLSPTDFRKSLKLKRRQLDVLVGCPPCQGFSRLRNRNRDGKDDARNDLVIRYLEYVSEFMPKYALFENVPGLIHTGLGREFYNKLRAGLIDLGYSLVEKEEEAADYGVPQRRRRVILIAGRDGKRPPFPKPTHGHPTSLEVIKGQRQPWRTVREAIGGKYPKLRAGENGEKGSLYPNHKAPMTGERVLGFISKLPMNGGSRNEVPKRFWLRCHVSHNGHMDVYSRVSWDAPANTITCGCTNPSKGRFVHPEQNRALTPREAAALQGFPDTFVFYGGEASVQVGNAVPPPLAYAIAKAIRVRIQRAIIRKYPRRKPLPRRVRVSKGVTNFEDRSPRQCRTYLPSNRPLRRTGLRFARCVRLFCQVTV